MDNNELAKNQKPKKNIGLWIAIILIIFLLLALLSQGENNTNNSSNTSQTQEKSEKTEGKIDTYKKSDVVKIDDLQVKVVGVKSLGDSISQEFGSPVTTQGNFVKVDFEVENLGKEAQYLGEMQLTDSQGRTFSEATDKFMILGDDANFFDKLNPNVPSKYSNVFDVAKDAKELKLKTNGFGLFNSKYVIIDLELSL